MRGNRGDAPPIAAINLIAEDRAGHRPGPLRRATRSLAGSPEPLTNVAGNHALRCMAALTSSLYAHAVARPGGPSVTRKSSNDLTSSCHRGNGVEVGSSSGPPSTGDSERNRFETEPTSARSRAGNAQLATRLGRKNTCNDRRPLKGATHAPHAPWP